MIKTQILNHLQTQPALRIYLAGRIRRNCWRVPLVGDEQGRIALDADLPSWQPLVGRIFGVHDYVGPFFISCDHGCGHDPMEARKAHEYDGSGTTHGRSSNGCTTSVEGNRTGRTRAFLDAMAGIRSCDIFFAYIEDQECYGTLAEIGYAAAHDKPVYICTKVPWSNDTLPDLWFAMEFAREIFHGDPEIALKKAIDCEQPIS